MKNFTKKEIASILDCSPRTIAEDIKHLRIKPVDIGDYGINYYIKADCESISELREHCRNGGTRETFINTTPAEIVNTNGSKLTVIKTKEEDNVRAFIRQEKEIDPLADLELLQRISDKQWLMPTKKLAAILDVSPNTLLNKERYNYCGFICTKEVLANATFLWRVTGNAS